MTVQLIMKKSRWTNASTTTHRDLMLASDHYCAIRNECGEGASTFPEGRVIADGKTLRISYNGRIWDGKTCVFSPYA